MSSDIFILKYIKRCGRVRTIDLAKKAGYGGYDSMSYAFYNSHLNQLVSAGILRKYRKGISVWYEKA
jgi:hypothetical protein